MSKKYTPKTIHLTGEGFEKVLGELEARVMELVWADGCVTARCVTDKLAQLKRKLSFNSVMTVLNRLTNKKLLKKKKLTDQYVFEPLITRAEFSRTVTRDIISSVVKDPALFSVASFTELAKDLDKETIKKLKQFLDQEAVAD